MFRKFPTLYFKASPCTLLAKATPICRLGRRKNVNNNLIDDSSFFRQSSAQIGNSDIEEGHHGVTSNPSESDEDFAAFVASRQQGHGASSSSSSASSVPGALRPLSSSKHMDEQTKTHSYSSKKSDNSPSGKNSSSSSSSSAPKGKRIAVNAGGKIFETYEGTLLQYPETPFGEMILEAITSAGDGTLESYQSAPRIEIFLDMDPNVFSFILQFLRSQRMVLPTDDEPLRFAINTALQELGLLDVAFPPLPADGGGPNGEGGDVDGKDEPLPMVRLPDVCVIQMCDHLQHDQGVKRHALNISYGSDGFKVRDLCKKIRKDLNGQLSNTYWQCYQTHERSMFLITTKIANGTADLMMASITQRLIEHTEHSMGYRLISSYVTLSPDIKNTNVRLFIHNLIFRRVRNPALEDTDAIQLFSNPDGSISAAMSVVAGMQHQANMKNREDETFVPNEEMFRNFEPPNVGPQDSYGKLGMPLSAPAGQRVPGNIWSE